MGASKRRVFLALSCGNELGRRLMDEALRVLGGAERAAEACRLVRPEGMHLTLFFAGDQPEAVVERLWSEVSARAVGLAAPRLIVRGTGAFPKPSAPRVLWFGLDEVPGDEPGSQQRGEGRLEELRSAVLAGVDAAGLDSGPERSRPFRPHVTLGRPRRAGGARRPSSARFEALYGLALDEPWEPERLVLMESVRGGGPARYPVLEECPLGR